MILRTNWWTIFLVLSNHIKSTNSVSNEKKMYKSDIHCIRKYKLPWSETFKYHFVLLSIDIFKLGIDKILNLYYGIVLRV